MTNSKTFTVISDGPEIGARAGDTVSYKVGGTFVATLVLERFVGGGYVPVQTFTSPAAGTLTVTPPPGTSLRQTRYRFRCTAYTSGTAQAWLDASPQVVERNGRHALPLYQTTARLTNAQIKTLPTVELEVLPAPGPNRLFVVVGWQTILSLYGGAVYSNVTGAYWYLLYGNSGEQASGTYYKPGAALTNPNAIEDPDQGAWAWMAGSPGYVALAAFDPDIAGSLLATVGTAGPNLTGGNSTNSPLVVKDDYAAGGVYTGGHDNNSLLVTVTYAVFNLVTGLFE